MKLKDEALRKKELEDLEEIEKTWKLYTMGAAGSNFLVTKGTEGIVVTSSLSEPRLTNCSFTFPTISSRVGG